MSAATLSQWLHLGAATAAVGGVLYARVVLMHSLRALPAEERTMVLKTAARRFNPILWTAIGVLLATGLYNVALAADVHGGDPVYWRLLGLKVMLALALFGLALGLTLPSPAFAALQKRRPQLLVLNLALAAVVLYLSAALRRL